MNTNKFFHAIHKIDDSRVNRAVQSLAPKPTTRLCFLAVVAFLLLSIWALLEKVAQK